MQADTDWYWYQQPHQHVNTVPTHTIIHPRLEVSTITDINDITKSVCNRTELKNNIKTSYISY